MMTKKSNTKRSLIMSSLALVLCITMLIGSTFAWFTDSVTSGGNSIQAGTLKVDLEDVDGNSVVGQSLPFVKAATAPAGEAVLWEPGCTYELTPVYVHNEGSLALKYKVVINGLDGDAKLLEAIDWSVKVDGTETDLNDFEETLNSGAKSENAIVLVGHMKEEAGNEYQGLTADGISITVYATQATVESDSFDNQYDKDATYPVATADELVSALLEGKNVTLSNDIALDTNTNIVIASGVEAGLDLNGYTLSSENTKTATHNFMIDVKGGELSISNGTVALEHTGANMGWNGAATVIDVTAGGVLNLDGVTVKNEGGTDMNFAVHLNNWGEVTMNADNCVFEATYCSVRVFNSGPNMNNVKITNSTMTGDKMGFWVHNYVSSDLGGKVYSGASAAYDKAAVDARLNLDIYGNNNTFSVANPGAYPAPIRYGFNSSVYYDANGNIVD